MGRVLAGVTDSNLTQMLKGSKTQKEEAFNEIFERYASTVSAYCKCVLKEDQRDESPILVDDIFQETFIRLYNSCVEGNEISNIHGFLISTARHLCLNYKRDRKSNISLDDIQNIDFGKNSNYDQKELLEIIILSLEHIEEKYRKVFLLHEFDGFSYSEIAQCLGISIDNAKTRAVRAKRKLIEILEPYLKDLNKY